MTDCFKNTCKRAKESGIIVCKQARGDVAHFMEEFDMTEKKVKAILAKQLGVDVNKISADTNIATDLGADSLDLVEILMSLEDEFKVSIPDDAIPGIKTVADLCKYIDTAGSY